MAAKKTSRCWPGYEPVRGKKANEQGSCKPKADAKSSPDGKEFKAKRKRQLDNWKKSHPGSPRKAAQHLSAPGSTPKSKAKPAAKKRAPAKRAASARKTAATRKRAARSR